MFRTALLMVTLALFCILCLAQQPGDAKHDGEACIMYGADHVFAIRVPKGWIVNPEIGKSLGLHAVMYPEGSSWRDSAVTMYSNFVHKDKTSNTLEKIISDDVAGYKKESPNVKVVDAESLTLAEGKEKVVVKYFSGDLGHNFEAVAYIEESKVVVMLVLTSRTENDFNATLPAFKQMVGSYRFISENVILPK